VFVLAEQIERSAENEDGTESLGERVRPETEHLAKRVIALLVGRPLVQERLDFACLFADWRWKGLDRAPDYLFGLAIESVPREVFRVRVFVRHITLGHYCGRGAIRNRCEGWPRNYRRPRRAVEGAWCRSGR